MTRACCAVASYGRGVAFLWFGGTIEAKTDFEGLI